MTNIIPLNDAARTGTGSPALTPEGFVLSNSFGYRLGRVSGRPRSLRTPFRPLFNTRVVLTEAVLADGEALAALQSPGTEGALACFELRPPAGSRSALLSTAALWVSAVALAVGLVSGIAMPIAYDLSDPINTKNQSAQHFVRMRHALSAEETDDHFKSAQKNVNDPIDPRDATFLNTLKGAK